MLLLDKREDTLTAGQISAYLYTTTTAAATAAAAAAAAVTIPVNETHDDLLSESPLRVSEGKGEEREGKGKNRGKEREGKK